MTSKSVEQQHGSTAVMHRMHPSFHCDSLQCRTMAMFMRPLVTEPKIHARVRRLQAKIDKLQKSTPSRVNGRTIYFQECMAMARVMQDGKADSRVPSDVKKGIMDNHGAQYAALPVGVRLDYQQQAARYADEKAHAAANETLHLEAQIDLTLGRSAADARASSLYTLEAAAFDSETKNMFETFAASPAFSHTKVAALRSEAAGPALIEYQDRLAISMQPTFAKAPAPRPPWLGDVCLQRNHLQSSAFLVDSGGDAGKKAFGFMFAMVNPYLLALEEFGPPGATGLGLDGGFGAEAVDDYFQHEFCTTGKYILSADADGMSQWTEDMIQAGGDQTPVHLFEWG